MDVIQNLKKLIASQNTFNKQTDSQHAFDIPLSRNYRVKKDFDTIQKMEFIEKAFLEIKEFLKRFIQEIVQIENIKTKILADDVNEFVCIIVNRNKIAAESQLDFFIGNKTPNFFGRSSTEEQIVYAIGNKNRPTEKNFSIDVSSPIFRYS